MRRVGAFIISLKQDTQTKIEGQGGRRGGGGGGG